MSSYHGGFGEDGVVGTSELTPFSDFTNINSPLYFHKFVYQFPDILAKVFRELPPWAFHKSIRSKQNIDNKQKSFDQCDWTKRKQSSPNAATEAAFKRSNKSNDQKNKIIQYRLLTNTSFKIGNKLSNKRALKRELLTERAAKKKVTNGNSRDSTTTRDTKRRKPTSQRKQQQAAWLIVVVAKKTLTVLKENSLKH